MSGGSIARHRFQRLRLALFLAGLLLRSLSVNRSPGDNDRFLGESGAACAGRTAFSYRCCPLIRGRLSRSRSAGVNVGDIKLVGADGQRSAYERIRTGEYQVVTVSEPTEMQAYQAVDEINRAIQGQPPSGFVQAPYLVTPQNVDAEGGDQNAFVPTNDYKKRYLELWGVAG